VRVLASLKDDAGSLNELINLWLDRFFNVATHVKCIEAGGNYLDQLRENLELQALREQVVAQVEETKRRCNELTAQFAAYDFLWKVLPSPRRASLCWGDGDGCVDGVRG